MVEPDFKSQPRPCPVCACCGIEQLYSQRFTVPSSGGVHGGYEVVACRRCGFTFAWNPPSQKFFEFYYDSLARKDEMLDPAAGFKETPDTIERNDESAVFLSRHLAPGSRVLDIGCYTGYLLRRLSHHVRDLRLAGLDPSSFAAGVATRFHQLDVKVGTVFDDLDLGIFDCVISSHVLEHLVEIMPFLERVRRLMADRGMFFVEVPDAAGFSADPAHAGSRAEPYFEYNFEHINYFTQTSLNNLLTMNGFEVIEMEARRTSLPVLAAVCRLRELPYAASDLSRYNYESERLHRGVAARIQTLTKSNTRFIIWGAGAHTQRLLAAGVLPADQIEFFVDANPGLRGAQLAGKAVLPPDTLLGTPPMPVVISSFRSERQIADRLRREFSQHTPILLYR